MKTKNEAPTDRTRLALRKQTLRALTDPGLAKVAGGAPAATRYCGRKQDPAP